MKKEIKKNAIIVCILALLLCRVPNVHAAFGQAQKPPSSSNAIAINTINEDYFWRLVQKQLSKKTLPNLEDKEIVLLVGKTGVGKSSFINRMLGHEFGWKYKKIKAQKTGWFDDLFNDGRGEKKLAITKRNPNAPMATIGDNAKSCTTVPQVYMLKPENLIFVDCPGFGDTTGVEQKILNLLMIRLLVQKAKKVKAVIGMIPYSTFTDGGKGAGFLNLTKQLNYLVAFEKCLPNILLGITRYPEGTSKATIVHKITEMKNAKEAILKDKYGAFFGSAFKRIKQKFSIDDENMLSNKVLLEKLLENKANILPLSPLYSQKMVTGLKKFLKENLQTSIRKAYFDFHHPTLDVKGIVRNIFNQPEKRELVRVYKRHKKALQDKAKTGQKIEKNKAIMDDKQELSYYVKNAVAHKKTQLAQIVQASEHLLNEVTKLEESKNQLILYRTESISLSARFYSDRKTITYNDFPFDEYKLTEECDNSKVNKSLSDSDPDNGVYKAVFTLPGAWDGFLNKRGSTATVTVKFYVKNEHVQQDLRTQKKDEYLQKTMNCRDKKKELALAQKNAAVNLKKQTEQVLPQKIKDLDDKILRLQKKLEKKEVFVYFIGEVYPCLYPGVNDYLNYFAKGYQNMFKLFAKNASASIYVQSLQKAPYHVPSSTEESSSDSDDDEKAQDKPTAEVPLVAGQLLIPANGQCLYTTVIMGYLLPVRYDADEATKRMDELFGMQPADYLNELHQTLQNPTHYLTYLHSDRFDMLVTSFMVRMKIRKSTWGGVQEIQTIATKLKVNIREYYPAPGDASALVPSDLTTPVEAVAQITLHIVRDKVHPEEVLKGAKMGSSIDNRYYHHFRLKYLSLLSSSAPVLPSQDPSVPHQIGYPQKSQPYSEEWFNAAKRGQVEWLRVLYNNCNIDVNHKNEYNDTALMKSASNGHLDCLKYLIQQGANINDKNEYKDTALLLSAENEHVDCIKYLLQQGANIYAKNDDGNTVLHLSAENGQLDCLIYLVQQGANVHTKNDDDNTALLLSARYGHINCLKYLVEQGADIYDKNEDNNTALLLSASQGHLACVKYLVQQGANIYDKNVNEETALLLSKRNGHLEIFKYLMQQEADIILQERPQNEKDLEWESMIEREEDVVNFLSTFENKAQPDQTVIHKWFEMAKNGNRKLLVGLYNSYNINVNAKNENEYTALHLSAEAGHLSCIKYLLQQGADINSRDKWAYTALHWSAYKGYLDCVKYLLQQGADINSTDKWAYTALLRSAKFGHLDCVKYLLKQGTDINARNKKGNTALILSASEGHLACVKYLIQQGANIHYKNVNEETALLLSNRNEHLDIFKYLMQQGADIILQGWPQNEKDLEWASIEGKEGVANDLSALAVKKPKGMLNNESYIDEEVAIIQKSSKKKPQIGLCASYSSDSEEGDTINID